MKKLKYITTLAMVVSTVLFSSCSKEFLDRTPTTALDTDLVLKDADLIPSTVVGTMRMMYSSAFGGKYATVIGDILTDQVTSVRGSNGSFKDMEEWNINQSTGDVETLYAACYQIAAAATRTIEAAKIKLQDSAALSSAQKNNLKNAIAASLTIKAYAEYFLVQYFCVDVNVGKGQYAFDNSYRMPGSSQTHVGVMILDGRPLTLTEPANTRTLKYTYEFLEKEIAEAIAYYKASGSKKFTLAGEERFYPTQCAAYVVQARIFLAQHKYQEAYDAATNAMSNLPAGANKTLISDAQKLVDAYGTTLSSEDIWTLNYTSQDNLSANSLQNLFSSYGFTPSVVAVSRFQDGDIRKNLYLDNTKTLPDDKSRTSWCLKYPNANAVFNVPLLRVPEIYMIQAEARAAGKLGDATEPLLAVLGARDTTVKGDINKLKEKYKVDDANIMQTIMDENAREFLCEGHRWFDMRRNGMRLTREGEITDKKFPTHFKNYPLSTFAFPVPYGETSTEQWQKGRGIFDDGRQDSKNWQSNAWDIKEGSTYSNSVTLPVEGGDYSSNVN